MFNSKLIKGVRQKAQDNRMQLGEEHYKKIVSIESKIFRASINRIRASFLIYKVHNRNIVLFFSAELNFIISHVK